MSNTQIVALENSGFNMTEILSLKKNIDRRNELIMFLEKPVETMGEETYLWVSSKKPSVAKWFRDIQTHKDFYSIWENPENLQVNEKAWFCGKLGSKFRWTNTVLNGISVRMEFYSRKYDKYKFDIKYNNEYIKEDYLIEWIIDTSAFETYPMCCICSRECEDRYGNNAKPMSNGRCCNNCNLKVIEARMIDAMELKRGYKNTGWVEPKHNKCINNKLLCVLCDEELTKEKVQDTLLAITYKQLFAEPLAEGLCCEECYKLVEQQKRYDAEKKAKELLYELEAEEEQKSAGGGGGKKKAKKSKTQKEPTNPYSKEVRIAEGQYRINPKWQKWEKENKERKLLESMPPLIMK